jgi:hypothetical protein
MSPANNICFLSVFLSPPRERIEVRGNDPHPFYSPSP